MKFVTFALLAALMSGGAGAVCFAASSYSPAHSSAYSTMPPCHRHRGGSNPARSNPDPADHPCCVRSAPSTLPAAILVPQPALEAAPDLIIPFYSTTAAIALASPIASSTGPPLPLTLRI